MRAAFTSQAARKAAKGEEERKRAHTLEKEEQLRALLNKHQIGTNSKERASNASNHQKGGNSEGGNSSKDPDVGSTESVKKESNLRGKKRIEADLKKEIQSHKREKKHDPQKKKTDAKDSAAETKTDAPLKTDKHDKINALFLRRRKTIRISKVSSDTDVETAQPGATSKEHPKEARKTKSDVGDKASDVTHKHKTEVPGPVGSADTPPKPPLEKDQKETIRPPKQEFAPRVRDAEPGDSKAVPRKYHKPPELRIEQISSDSGAGETRGPARSIAVRSQDLREVEIETSKIVTSLRRSRERLEAVPWLMSPTATAAVIFLIAVFIVCVELKYLVLLLAIPFLEKSMEGVLKRCYRNEYTLMDIQDSKDKDFLRRLVREIETRTTAKIKRKLFHALAALE